MADVKISALPLSGTIVAASDALPIVNGGITAKTTPTAIVNAALPTVSASMIPTVDDTYSLGSPLLRWSAVHIGPGSLFLQDTNNAGLNVEITVTDGVLLVNGSTTFQVGNIRITDPSPGNPTVAAINGDPLYLFGNTVTVEDDAGEGRLTCGQGGIAINSDATNITVTNGTIKLEGANVPAHSYGVAGDQAGMVAFDSTYMYYCTSNYVNTSTNIWKRIAWDTRTW
jgi:hypothetical protein